MEPGGWTVPRRLRELYPMAPSLLASPAYGPQEAPAKTAMCGRSDAARVKAGHRPRRSGRLFQEDVLLPRLVRLVADGCLDSSQAPQAGWKQIRRRHYGADRISEDGMTLYNPAKLDGATLPFRRCAHRHAIQRGTGGSAGSTIPLHQPRRCCPKSGGPSNHAHHEHADRVCRQHSAGG